MTRQVLAGLLFPENIIKQTCLFNRLTRVPMAFFYFIDSVLKVFVNMIGTYVGFYLLFCSIIAKNGRKHVGLKK